jgi:hypothetical protein
MKLLRYWFNSAVTLLDTEVGHGAASMFFLPGRKKLKRLGQGLGFLHTYHYYREYFVSKPPKGNKGVEKSGIVVD